MNSRVFLDYQAATPVLPEVVEAMASYWSRDFANPGSLHQEGMRVRKAIDQVRSEVACWVGAKDADAVVFTSGATESANLAIKGVAWANQRFGNHIILSATEHPAVRRSVDWLVESGFCCSVIPVDSLGRVDPEAVRAQITDRTLLICLHQANHDIGTIQPIAEVGRMANERGVLLFVDSAAGGAWLPIDVESMGIDLLSLSPHRFGGPKGVGILVKARRARLAPLIHGGNQEGGLRAGTENVPGIVGAGVAIQKAQAGFDDRVARTRTLQGRFWKDLQQQIPLIHLNGPEPGPERLPNSLHFCVEFVEGEGLALNLDMQGVAVASGPSCVTGGSGPPPVLQAIGLPSGLWKSSLLASLQMETTEPEISRAVAAAVRGVSRMRSMSSGWAAFQAGEAPSIIRSMR